MTYDEAIDKKIKGDYLTVSQMCGLTPAHTRLLVNRKEAKKYKMVMDALVKVVESRELLINENKL